MSSPSAPSSLFGRYEILDRLAAGGMAELFLARSASLGGVTRTCVIKRILPQHCTDRNFVSMFIDEARIIINLEHPNIVKLYDFGQIDGAYFMCLEYVEGFDLARVMSQLIQRGAGADPLAVAYVGHAMACALDHAHGLRDHVGQPLGVVHRDVTPHNVLLSFSGEVKLIDFGIARVKNRVSRTRPGVVIGKFAYLSPEQATAEAVDARSDLFSAGVVLHELLTGVRLFAAATPIDTITRVLEHEIPYPSAINPAVPELLDRVVRKALRRNPKRRYQSGASMAAELEPYLREHSYGAEAFASFLDLFEEEPARRGGGAGRISGSIRTGNRLLDPDQDDVITEHRRSLRLDPNLWTLTSIGERLLAMGERVRAMSALRTAAALFANQGLLVQAVVALEPIRHLCDEGQRERDLIALAHLRDGDRRTLARHLHTIDGGDAYKLVQPLGVGSLEDDEPFAQLLTSPTPLLGQVRPEQFAALVDTGRVRHLALGEQVVREGDRGEAVYAVGRGRVVVYCSPPEGEEELGDEGRVYLSSLSEGDFFGEFGFLTGQPRTATVETISDVWLLELSRREVDALVDVTPALARALLDYYMERVAELMMAKSPVFAVLEPHQRKVFLANAFLQSFRDNEEIVREGAPPDALFFIKRGEVEVYTERQGVPIFLNKLAEGDFFGEISALRGVPRTASVRAIGDVELLRVERSYLQELLDSEPRLCVALERAADERSHESAGVIATNVDLLLRL